LKSAGRGSFSAQQAKRELTKEELVVGVSAIVCQMSTSDEGSQGSDEDSYYYTDDESCDVRDEEENTTTSCVSVTVSHWPEVEHHNFKEKTVDLFPY